MHKERESLNKHIEFDGVPNSPEKTLIAAVLERAYRDLGIHKDHYYRKESISWFRGYSKEHNNFTFQFCCEELNLTASQVKYLLRAVKRAELYERRRTTSDTQQEGTDVKAEGKEGGKRTGPHAKRPRVVRRETNRPVQRNERRFGCRSPGLVAFVSSGI